MKRTVLLLTMVSIGLGLAGTAAADSPPVIPIQGVLMDKNKVPIDSSVEIRFSLHDAETNGNELWFETQTVPVNDGLFTTYLGSESLLNLAMFRDNSDLWLGMKVGDDEDMPRIYLGSTPFAGYAQYSSGGTLSELNCTDGQVAQKSGNTWVCAPLPDARNFVHWGAQTCPGSYQTLYAGYLLQSGGAAHHGGDSVCAEGTQRQVYRHYAAAYAWEAPLYCAVCAHPNAKFCFSHWGATGCPAGFTATVTGNMYTAGQNDGYGGRWLCAAGSVRQGTNYENPMPGEGGAAWFTARSCSVCCSD